METSVEFSLEGVLCRVVPEERVADPEGQTRRPPGQSVVGSCRLDGRRYLILCSDGLPERPPERPAAACEVLTGRELQVAVMVGQGFANKQIAKRLGLSEWTVTSYVRRTFAKLGVRSRAAMVARILADLNG
jgi:DNA-binding CsgD family transcriptional regulator